VPDGVMFGEGKVGDGEKDPLPLQLPPGIGVVEYRDPPPPPAFGAFKLAYACNPLNPAPAIPRTRLPALGAGTRCDAA